MFDFTVIEKHETCLDEWLWENGFRAMSEKVSAIEDHAPDGLASEFEEAIENIIGSDMNWGEIESDDLWYICDSDDDLKELVDKTYEVAEKFYDMDDGYTYAKLVEYLADRDPYDPPYDDTVADGKIDFYAKILEMIEDDKEELISQLTSIREDVGDDTEEAETIDDYIEMLKGEE